MTDQYNQGHINHRQVKLAFSEEVTRSKLSDSQSTVVYDYSFFQDWISCFHALIAMLSMNRQVNRYHYIDATSASRVSLTPAKSLWYMSPYNF